MTRRSVPSWSSSSARRSRSRRRLRRRPAQLAALVRALTVRGARDAPTAVVSNLRARNPFFTGRDGLIELVHAALDDVGRVGLTGMPGVGKTQVALECAARRRERYRALLWVHAESRDSVYGDTARIARLVGFARAHRARSTARARVRL